HSIPWRTIRRVLSVPTLREFVLQRFIFAPDFKPQDIEGFAPVSLRSFEARFNYPIPCRPESLQSETRAFSTVLSKLHDTLETLHLPGPSAPADLLTTSHWPRLRELVLYSEPWDASQPWHAVTLFSNMPHLRTLALKFLPPRGKGLLNLADSRNGVVHHSRETERTPLWPPGYTGPFPWPELDRLVVSCPNVDDEVYEHLPQTLRSLSLRYWKHLFWLAHERTRAETPDHRAYHTAGSTLTILRRCAIPALEQLTVEYVEDDREEELLRLLGTAFPRLRELTVLQY
ncbi:uncharacterized protein BXZ73DRAFT_21652, partial [Epithele typhae]|uniref:uncharacterized protein n=1 Tax=Epithele typhae TaxID=378194 RepID=UPI0020079208